MPLISVIVPVFNKKDYIPACLDSILTWGGYDESEIILIDDGSTDGSAEILDDYQRRNPNLIVRHQINGGVSTARNSGMSIATGTYITFVDADDEVVPGTLDTVLSYISSDENNRDIYVTSAVHEGHGTETSIFQDKLFLDEDVSAALTFILTGGTEEKRIPGKATIFMSGCKEKFYKISFLRQHGITFDSELSRNEDVLFSSRAYYQAESIRFLPVTTYVMKDDPNGITKGMNIVGTVDNHKKFLKKFDANFAGLLSVQHLSNFYFHQSLIIAYEVHRALKGKLLTEKNYRAMNKDWYSLTTSQYMLKHLEAGKLSIFKRIAFYLMKLHMYRLVGIEMDVHHRHR